MGAPCAASWIARAAAELGGEPPVAEPGHVAGLAWFDQLVARLLHEGLLERVTLDAPAVVAGIEVLSGASILVVDEGRRGYLVQAR